MTSPEHRATWAFGAGSRTERSGTHRCPSMLMLLLLLSVTIGCESGWQGGWARPAPVRRVPARDAELAEVPRQQKPVEVEVGNDGQVDAARAEVLEFIERLEKAEEESKRAASRSRRDESSPPAGTHPQRLESHTSSSTQAPSLAEGLDTPMAQTPGDGVLQSDTRVDSVPEPRTVVDDREGRRARTTDGESAGIPPRVLKVWIGEPDQTGEWEADTPADSDLSAPVANMPVTTHDQPTARADDAAELIAGLEKQVADDPDNEQARWRLALVRLAYGKSDCSAGKGLPQSEPSGALLKKSICTLAAAKRAVEDPISAVDEALATVDELRSELRERAVLTIPTVALCTRVQAFGVYEELPEGFLRAYAQNQAIAYFEVKNFTSEKTPDGRFRTLLSDRFEILTTDGGSLWQHAEPEIEDLSRRRREDFFVAQRIVIPPVLGPGQYVLKVTVEDRLADKQTQSLIRFNVSAGFAGAARR